MENFAHDIPHCGGGIFGYYSKFHMELSGSIEVWQTKAGNAVEVTNVTPICPRCTTGKNGLLFVGMLDYLIQTIVIDQQVYALMQSISRLSLEAVLDGEISDRINRHHRLETLLDAGVRPAVAVKSALGSTLIPLLGTVPASAN